MNLRFIFVFVITASLSLLAAASGLPPWQLGMTKSQVASFKEFGPYRSFPNGDLETYNGRFHGRKTNIQFFFQGDRLRRIAVYLYEGTDPKGGIPALRLAYDALEKDYGNVKVPEMGVGSGSDPLNSEVIAIGAAANADVTGETHLIPAEQPADMRVLARIFTGIVQGKKWYYVIVSYDPNA